MLMGRRAALIHAIRSRYSSRLYSRCIAASTRVEPLSVLRSIRAELVKNFLQWTGFGVDRAVRFSEALLFRGLHCKLLVHGRIAGNRPPGVQTKVVDFLA